MADATLIGIDVGTTAIKAILIDLDGKTIADVRTELPDQPTRSRAMSSRTRPTGWMASSRRSRAFAAAHDLGGLAGIGLCSQVNTHVFVDADGDPLSAGNRLAGRALWRRRRLRSTRA